VSCKRCNSPNQCTFNGEVAIHCSGPERLDEPTVLVFPKLAVCLHCGLAEFTVTGRELRLLAQDPSTAALPGGQGDSSTGVQS